MEMSSSPIWKQSLSFNGVTLTEESIKEACKYYADNALACLYSANEDDWFVDDLDGYRRWMQSRYDQFTSGILVKPSVTLLQRAYVIQTGESVA